MKEPNRDIHSKCAKMLLAVEKSAKIQKRRGEGDCIHSLFVIGCLFSSPFGGGGREREEGLSCW